MEVGTIISWNPDKHLKDEDDVIIMEGIIYEPKGIVVIGKMIYKDWTIRDSFPNKKKNFFSRSIELNPSTAVSTDYFLAQRLDP